MLALVIAGAICPVFKSGDWLPPDEPRQAASQPGGRGFPTTAARFCHRALGGGWLRTSPAVVIRLCVASLVWYPGPLMSTPPQITLAALRRGALEGLASSESTAWVEFLVASLEKDGRPIEGGWPGTVSEARRRLTLRLMASPQEPAADVSEVNDLVDLLYSEAKRLWHHRTY